MTYPHYEGAAVGFKTAAWCYHLQMMVIAQSPMEYLGRHIDAA